MGVGFPGATLFTAGLAHVPFWRFMQLNAMGQVVWTGMLIAIGYFLGNFYVKVNDIIGLISAFAIMLLVLVAFWGFGRYVRARLVKKIS